LDADRDAKRVNEERVRGIYVIRVIPWLPLTVSVDTYIDACILTISQLHHFLLLLLLSYNIIITYIYTHTHIKYIFFFLQIRYHFVSFFLTFFLFQFPSYVMLCLILVLPISIFLIFYVKIIASFYGSVMWFVKPMFFSVHDSVAWFCHVRISNLVLVF
jgi:hypothetical protein